MKNLLLLLPLYVRRKGGLLLALFCALATVAAGVGLLGVSGWFLTGAALAGAGSVFNLFAPSSLVRGLSFLRIVSRYADRVVGHSATLRLLADLRAMVFAALIRLTPRQLARYRSGDLVARMTGDVDALDTVFLFVLAPLATAILAGAVLTAVLGLWVPAAALAFALALLTACVAVPLWLLRAARKPGAAAQESAAGLRAATLDAVDGPADMVALQAQAQTLAHFERLCEASALLKACHRNVSVTVRQEYPVSGIQGFYYRVDSVWYTGERGKQYQYRIAFGERNPEGTIVWAADPLYIHKTANGSIASGSTFEEVGDHRWSRQYSVLMGLGQPDSLMNHIEKAFLVVASTEVNMTKQ